MRFSGKYVIELLAFIFVLVIPLVMGAWHTALGSFLGYAAVAGAGFTTADLLLNQSAPPAPIELFGEWLGKSVIVCLIGGMAFVVGLHIL